MVELEEKVETLED
jgi:hypothetical protein